MTIHDLRRHAHRLTELRRKFNAHEPLTKEEREELDRGNSALDMRAIVESIRGPRRSAEPARKVKQAKERHNREKAKSQPIDIYSFLDEDQDDSTKQ